MQTAFARTPARKFRAAQFFLLPVTVVLSLALCRMVWAGNYFQGVTPAAVPWPGGIVPYAFDTNYSITSTQKNIILAGLREWELAANVKFVPHTSQSSYVLLQYTNDGSGTGYYLSGSPTTNAFMMLHGLARGLMCHEAGHLFGLQHEHQRIDRDNYIFINTNNIIGGTNDEGGLGEFLINSNSTAFGAYDLVSVMHYGADTFTNGLGDSLDPQPAYQKFYHKLGNLALSIGDRAAVSNLYGAPLTPLCNVVTNTADGGFGSLRAAIYYANDHPGTTIRFNIPNTDPNFSNGIYTISLLGDLPPLVSAGTLIDGTSQNGFVNHPVIVVDGSQVPAEAGPVSGLHLYGTNCTVRALAFNNFSSAGVQLFCADATSNHVENCYLGVKPDGTNAAPNFNAGIYFQFGAHDNVIGGLYATQRNLISGNAEYGIQINDTNSDGNVILGNYIGMDASGTTDVTNFYSGIGIWNGPRHTLIGGTNAGAGNVISGNGQYGVYISDASVSGTTIQGNFIGTDFSGSNSIPNGNAVTNSYGGIGIFSGAHDNLVGGTTILARNIISGNTNAGIYLANPGVTNNLIEGNFIGLDVSGTTTLGSQQNGILIFDGVSGNTVGGTSAGARNVISGNQAYGLYISDPGTSNNFVLGNFIGPDATGTKAIGDGGFGIGMWNGTSGNVIGGTNAGAGNLISGNPGFSYGVAIGSANGNLVEGNFIGTDLTGTNALANGFADVALWGGSTGNTIGGVSAGAGNVIAFAGEAGVVLYDAATTNNPIRGNSIFGNGYLGINFGNLGVIANDLGDADTGPNDLQNFPVITNAFGYAASTIVLGKLNSAANRSFFIDVYRNAAADYSGYGEGQIYVGTASVTTDASGNGTFALTNSAGNFTGQYFSATATSAGGDTSEFGADVLASNAPAPSAQFNPSFAWRTNGFVFNLTFATNFSYHIQATTNLAANPIPWINLTNFTATNFSLTFTDRTATNFRARFYRVVSP